MANKRQSVGNLVIGLEADATGVKTGVAEARQSVSNFANTAGSDLQKLSNSTKRANDSFRQFGQAAKEGGHEAVTGMQATSSALRTLSGNVTQNLRSAERFVASLPGVANALKLAFPVTGAIAVSGILSELIERVSKVKEAFKEMATAPQRIAAALDQINKPLAQTNDELGLSNAKLEQEIAKLQGKPQNNLKVALFEARVEADKLAASLQKDLDQVGKVIEQNSIGTFAQIFGKASNADIKESFIGKEGYGGFQKQIDDITTKYAGLLAASTNAKDADKLRHQQGIELEQAYAAQIDKTSKMLKERQALQAQYGKAPAASTLAPNISGYRAINTQDQRASIAELQKLLNNLRTAHAGIALQIANGDLTNTVDTLHTNSNNAKLGSKGPLNYDAVSLRAFQVGIAQQTKVAQDWQTRLQKIQQLSAQMSTEVGGKLDEEKQKREAILTNLNEQIDAARQLSAAEKQGSEAAWQAQEKLRLSRIADSDIRSLTGKRDEAQHQAQIEGTVLQINRETDALKALTAEFNKGRDAQRQAAIDRVRNSGASQDVINAQVANLQAQFSLQDKQAGRGESASEGMRRYFQELKDNSLSTGQIVERTLGGAFDSVNDSISRLIQGQKVSWGSFFSGLAAQFASLGLSKLESSLLGGLFSGSNNTGSAVASAAGNSGLISGIGKLFGKFAGAFADGGSLAPGTWGIAGEAGPEIIHAGASGLNVTSNKALRSMNGGATYYIDARGADAAAVDARVQKALVQVHGSAIRTATFVDSERRLRSPRSAFR